MSEKPDTPKAGHTPGPWRVNEDNEQIGDVWAVSPEIPIAQAQIIGTNAYPDHSTRRANARLIAAAPDLLRALEAAKREMQRHLPIMERAELDTDILAGTGIATANGYRRSLQIIDAALAKAKGNTP